MKKIFYSIVVMAILLSPFFNVATVGASSKYDGLVKTTNKLLLQNPYDEDQIIDVSTTYITDFTSCFNDHPSATVSDRNAFDLFKSNISNPETKWVITMVDKYTMRLAYAETGGKVNFYDMNDFRSDLSPSSSPMMIFQSDTSSVKSFDLMIAPWSNFGKSGNFYCYSSGGSNNAYGFMPYGQVITSKLAPDNYAYNANAEQEKIFLINAPVNYPEGYTGTQPPSSWQPSNVPNFLVNLNKNGDLTVNYMQNLTKHPPEFYYKIGTGVDASNNMIDEIDSQRVQFRNPYYFTLPSHGDYYLEISPNYPPPSIAPENAPPTVKFKITHDGTDKIWGNINQKLCDEDGLLCTSPAENCGSYSFFLEKHACILKQNTNLGVINTSILEMTKIYSKMRVDEKNYTCGFNLPAFKYQNKNVFNTTAIITEGCQKSVVVHNTFPFIKLVVNFSFLMGVLWLLSRIVNKILNRHDDNITEGLE